jgi:AraC-like DNA-binding protein
MNVDEEETSGYKSSPSAMYLLSFLSDFQQFAGAGTAFKSIRVIMSKEWLARYLRIEKMDEVLQRYLSLKAKSFHVKEVDLDSRLLMNEIFQTSQDLLFEAAFVQNRIMKILENFFSWMYQQMSQVQLTIRLSRDEVDKLMEIESVLINDLSSAPTINQLSRKAAMSPSKLKKQFKDVYGLPLYEYFQKHRMNKARELLLSGNRSIKEVGLELGYSNLSNFSLAFKKVFNHLPSELLKGDIRRGSEN